MSFADRYLAAQKDFYPYIKEKPEHDLNIIVVIPCFNEPDLITTLESLRKCSKTVQSCEIIVVFNAAEGSPARILEQNRRSFGMFENWREHSPSAGRKFYSIWKEDLPDKFAGAGLARKIGMDEAIFRFNRTGNDRGVIASFDADTVCDPDYLSEIERHYRDFPDTNGTTVYFEHPLSGDEYPDRIYQGVLQYELNLRYHNSALKWCGFPYGHHTIGSCFTVKALCYVRQGGMNKRKAGEDFYFIQKLAPLGNFHNITTTRVIPSPRPSDRVPFGTGSAVLKFVRDENEVMLTYHPDAFRYLRSFFLQTDQYYGIEEEKIPEKLEKLPGPVREFLDILEFTGRITEINSNSSSPESFRKRFFRWFNAFRIIKYLNFVHMKHFTKIPVAEAGREILKETGLEIPENTEASRLLEIYRKLERFDNK
ncbi:MAG: glycosyltransferase family 2 protein [Bacteroidales bacterium]|nr:MAG: glycosyltransferase family 2 protein [Bacteroidales bacterium]